MRAHADGLYYSWKKLSSMVEDWISQANARQCQGRAGHVRAGICFCLYTRQKFEKLMRSYQVGSLEGDEELTPLGHHLAKLPVDVLIGKMMLYGAIFGRLSPILSISAFLSYKSPFVYPKNEKQNVERAKLMSLNEKLDGPRDSNDVDRQLDHLLMMRWERILTEYIFIENLAAWS